MVSRRDTLTAKKHTKKKTSRSVATRKKRVVKASSTQNLLGDICLLIDESRASVARSVNTGLVWLYWNIGKRIREDYCKRAAGDQYVEVRMPVKKFAMSLNRRHHAGCHILAPEQANRFGLEARPGTSREFAQQLAAGHPVIRVAGVQPKTLGDGQDDLPMRDGKTDFFGNVDRGQQRPLLVAGWAGSRFSVLILEVFQIAPGFG